MTVAPIDEFGFDAAILFSDILVHLPAMGLDLSFEKGEKGKGDGGPKIANPVRTRADVDALRVPEPTKDLPYVLDGVRAIRSALARSRAAHRLRRRPVHRRELRRRGRQPGVHAAQDDALAEPQTAHALFEKLTRAAIVQIEAQIAAGAQAAQIFESWLGELDRDDLEAFAFPYLARIAEAVRRTGVPSIFFATGMSGHLEAIAKLGYDVVSVDWRIPIDEARRARAGRRHPGQPGLDRAPRAEVGRGRARALRLRGPRATRPDTSSTSATASRSATPPETVKAVVDAVHAFSWK